MLFWKAMALRQAQRNLAGGIFLLARSFYVVSGLTSFWMAILQKFGAGVGLMAGGGGRMYSGINIAILVAQDAVVLVLRNRSTKTTSTTEHDRKGEVSTFQPPPSFEAHPKGRPRRLDHKTWRATVSVPRAITRRLRGQAFWAFVRAMRPRRQPSSHQDIKTILFFISALAFWRP